MHHFFHFVRVLSSVGHCSLAVATVIDRTIHALVVVDVTDIFEFLHLNDISVQSVPVVLFLFLHEYFTEGDSQLILGAILQVILGVISFHSYETLRLSPVENLLEQLKAFIFSEEQLIELTFHNRTKDLSITQFLGSLVINGWCGAHDQPVLLQVEDPEKSGRFDIETSKKTDVRNKERNLVAS